jgi:hypothetical protein
MAQGVGPEFKLLYQEKKNYSGEKKTLKHPTY